MQISSTNLTNDVDRMGRFAERQIIGFRDATITQAKVEVERVFQYSNMQQYVIDVARTQLEKKMTNIADSTVKRINAERIDSLIKKLENKNLSIANDAYSALWEDRFANYSPQHLQAMINFVESGADVNIRGSVLSLLSIIRSPLLVRYFEERFKDPSSFAYETSFYYLTSIAGLSDIQLYEQYFINSKDKRTTFSQFISNAMSKRQFLLSILNSRPIVDSFFKAMGQDQFPVMQKHTRESTANVLTPEQFNQTYIATKK